MELQQRIAEYQKAKKLPRRDYNDRLSNARKRKTRQGGFFLDGASRRITQRKRFALRAVAKATLSFFVLPSSSYLSESEDLEISTFQYGASRRIRTSDRSVRSRVLYPAELWMHYYFWFVCLKKQVRQKEWCIQEDSNLRPLGS